MDGWMDGENWLGKIAFSSCPQIALVSCLGTVLGRAEGHADRQIEDPHDAKVMPQAR